MLICPHYQKNQREGTFDGVTKYTDELIRSLQGFSPPLRLQLSQLQTGPAYYLDALAGFFAHRLETRRKRPRLVLITCDGSFDEAAGGYARRAIVYAVASN